MADSSLADISPETIERDYHRSEAVLARTQRSAVLALLAFLVECGVLGMAIAYGIDTAGSRNAPPVPVWVGVIGFGATLPIVPLMVTCLIYVAWPVTGRLQRAGMNEYCARLKQEESGPSISEAYTFSTRVYRRVACARVMMWLLLAFAAGTLMFLAAL